MATVQKDGGGGGDGGSTTGGSGGGSGSGDSGDSSSSSQVSPLEATSLLDELKNDEQVGVCSGPGDAGAVETGMGYPVLCSLCKGCRHYTLP
jgi:hypothetical protein